MGALRQVEHKMGLAYIKTLKIRPSYAVIDVAGPVGSVQDKASHGQGLKANIRAVLAPNRRGNLSQLRCDGNWVLLSMRFRNESP